MGSEMCIRDRAACLGFMERYNFRVGYGEYFEKNPDLDENGIADK